MFKSAVFHGNSFLGEVEIHPQNSNNGSWIREIRISHLSPSSERCPPLAVLHTVAADGFCFKMETKSPPSDDSPLFLLHATLSRENKTAVIPLGEVELHLVAMSSRKNPVPYTCFWGFIVPSRLYDSSVMLLNLRCLGIVFDLDETLIVANTMRSFEDRIDALQRKINNETDPQRIAGMLAEIKRYQDDKLILKQYADSDQVVENGKVFKVLPEMVLPLSDSHQVISRPVIRLQEKNIILTRVNPAIRDTSVLVRLRPAWEELRSYLTARGRKRFEVYVCTMSERDYALEMWRLLDPDSSLIHSSKLLDRVVCVKSGLRKSLFNVFQDGICHPKMALVIDDRLKVWDEKDQPRVHVVPAFAPYYSPQAEANSMIPVLCVARNVACNVRGCFFKDFDEGILTQISDVLYEDELKNFPHAPDVGNYLISEDGTSTSNVNKDQLRFDGMADAEVERRLKEASCNVQAIEPVVTNFGLRPVSSLQHVNPSSFSTASLAAMQMTVPLPNNQCTQSVAVGRPLGQLAFPEPSFQGSPAREEGEVPDSELDPDTRRRLLILQHGQDTREPTPSYPITHPLHVSIPPVQPQGSWFPLEEEINPRKQSRTPQEISREPEAARFRKRPRLPSLGHGRENSVPLDRVHEARRLQLRNGGDRARPNDSLSNLNSSHGEEMPTGRNSSSLKDAHFESRQTAVKQAESPAGALQEIAMKCGNKAEFRCTLCDTTELQFSIQVWFVGEKLGEGFGKTRKEAQHRAAETSLRHLADKYLSSPLDKRNTVHGDRPRNDPLPVASTSEDFRSMDQRVEGSRRSSITSLKELCVREGFNLVFRDEPSTINGSIRKEDVSAQVTVNNAKQTFQERNFKSTA